MTPKFNKTMSKVLPFKQQVIDAVRAGNEFTVRRLIEKEFPTKPKLVLQLCAHMAELQYQTSILQKLEDAQTPATHLNELRKADDLVEKTKQECLNLVEWLFRPSPIKYS